MSRWIVYSATLLVAAAGACTTEAPAADTPDASTSDAPMGDARSGDTTNNISPTPWRACGEMNFCSLAEPGCCWTCGNSLPLESLEPVGFGGRQVLAEETCGEVSPACDDCAPAEVDFHFFAICEAGTCQARDIRDSELAECTDDAECVALWADCCQCGPNVSALNASSIQAYRQAVCNPAADCRDCPAVEPTESAACVDGHCVVVE